MTTRYHYDAQGHYRGRSLSDSDLALELVGIVIVVPVVLAFVAHWIWQGLIGYAKLAIPYKWLVGYYYFTGAVPFLWADELSRRVLKSTPWPNLNLVLGVLAFFGTWLLPYAAVIKLIRRIPSGRRAVPIVFLGPFFALVIWWTGESVVAWLFAR
jgi:hypothetical protein